MPSGKHGHGHGHGGGRTMSYTNASEEGCYGAGQQQMQQGYYKKEEKAHKNRERMGKIRAWGVSMPKMSTLYSFLPFEPPA